MIEPTGKLVHALSAEYHYIIAPFAENVSTAETGWWESLLRQTPSVDIVALQDGVGVSQGWIIFVQKYFLRTENPETLNKC